MSGENASLQASLSLQIAGRTFQFHHHRGDDNDLYFSEDAYLRIGDRAELEPEYETHVRMLQMGFPVPQMLARGEWNGRFYWIEESVGTQVLWKLFMAETRANGCMSDASFRALMEVMGRYAEAQVRHPVAGDIRAEFQELVRVNDLIEELPDLRDRTLRAFERAVERLQVFPGAWCHRDLATANICERGVIDLEGVRPGYAGYDVMGALLEPDVWAAPDGYAYSPRQREVFLTPVDRIFTAQGLPAPSAYAPDFLFCRLLCLAAGCHLTPGHPLPGQVRWLHNRYRTVLNEYERKGGGN
jgi:hypothetical protein